jgi:hypothetical protein
MLLKTVSMLRVPIAKVIPAYPTPRWPGGTAIAARAVLQSFGPDTHEIAYDAFLAGYALPQAILYAKPEQAHTVFHLLHPSRRS